MIAGKEKSRFPRLSPLLNLSNGGGRVSSCRWLMPPLAIFLFSMLPGSISAPESLESGVRDFSLSRIAGDLDSRDGQPVSPDLPIPEPRLRVDRFMSGRLLVKSGGRTLPECPSYDGNPFAGFMSGPADVEAGRRPLPVSEEFFPSIIVRSTPVRAGPDFC